MKIYEDVRTVQDRVGLLQSALVLFVILLASWFWHLQIVRGREFREQAESNRIRAVPVPAPRGALLDHKGRVLVENRSSFNIVLTPEHGDDPDVTVGRLSRLLGMGEGLIRERLLQRGVQLRSVVIKQDAGIEDISAIEGRRLELPEAGVNIVPLRSYPLGAAAAQALGHVGEISEAQLALPSFAGLSPGALVGQAGLELQYNRQLMGVDGERQVIVNSRGVEVGEKEGRRPKNGPNLGLYLDADLQVAVEEAMSGKNGSVVALDPRTGGVLAITSAPAYDPNQFAAGVTAPVWNRLRTDPDRPLMNRVIQGQYAPGSVFKVVMAIAGLEEGVITPASTAYCPGQTTIYGNVFRCHKKEGHGTVDLKRAIALSCNVFFYQVGVRLEIDRIARWAKRLGLGSPTGIDLPHEASGLIPSPQWKLLALKQPWYAGETVSVAIGQGQVSVTPIQLARLAAIVARGGSVPRPRFVESVAGEALPVDEVPDLALRPSTVAFIQDAMRTVVEEGTGRLAAVKGIGVGGKTGSAQVVAHARLEKDKHDPKIQPHGWFICFAPIEAPRIAMAVLVEHGQSGGASAAPVAGKILAHFFRSGAVGPTGEPLETDE